MLEPSISINGTIQNQGQVERLGQTRTTIVRQVTVESTIHHLVQSAAAHKYGPEYWASSDIDRESASGEEASQWLGEHVCRVAGSTESCYDDKATRPDGS